MSADQTKTLGASQPASAPRTSPASAGRSKHPDPHGAPDLTPIEIGEVWVNPATGERGRILEFPFSNPERRATVELTALVGARVVGEHRHSSLVERFTVLEGELTLKLNGKLRVLRVGESAVVEPGVWHDWWNASDRDALARVEITPGERFAYLIETLWGLARLGYTDSKGMPNPLQLALTAREFSDVMELRTPPPAVQRAIFGALAPIAHWRGYRATYPQISRTVAAPHS